MVQMNKDQSRQGIHDLLMLTSVPAVKIADVANSEVYLCNLPTSLGMISGITIRPDGSQSLCYRSSVSEDTSMDESMVPVRSYMPIPIDDGEIRVLLPIFSRKDNKYILIRGYEKEEGWLM